MISLQLIRGLKRFAAAALVLLSVGCLDELDIDAPANVQDGVVITSRLIQGTAGAFVSVELNRVFDFTGQSLQSVGAREVVLSNDIGEQILLPELRAGLHQLFIPREEPFTIEDGMSFQLSISTFDGREIVSQADRLEPVPEVMDVTARMTMKDGVDALGEDVRVPFLEFLVETPVKIDASVSESVRLKWDFRRTYAVRDEDPDIPGGKVCYITEVPDPNRIAVADGSLFNSDVINATVYDEQITARFAEGYYLTVIQQSLSEEAFDYWDAVAQSVERTGNLFEPPAGRIKTNFEVQMGSEDTDIFGFFYVSNQSFGQFYVSPEMANNPTTFCPPPPTPPPPGGGCAFPICCDCLSVNGSTTIRPNFWIEEVPAK